MRRLCLKSGFLAGIMGVMLFGGVALADVEDKNEVVMHAPDEVVGAGEYSIRRTIFDPVTQQPWALQPYRLGIYDHGARVADYEGRTDAEGRTLTVRFPKPLADEDVIARPVIGTGKYEAAVKFVFRDGSKVENQLYLIVFDGRIFVGMTDNQGNTAEVRSEQAGVKVNTIVLGDEAQMPTTWREEATILNRTIDAKTPQERIALLEQARAYKQSQAQPYSSLADMEGTTFLRAELQNALLAPDALPDVEQRLIDAYDEGASDNPAAASGSAGSVDSSIRLNTLVRILTMEKEAGATSLDPQSSIMQQAITLSQNLPESEREHALDSVLFISQALVDAGQADLAEKIMHANALDEKLSDFPGVQRQLGMLSRIALARGNTDRAQSYFSVANVLQAVLHLVDKSEDKVENQEAEPDDLSDLRARFHHIGAKDMLVSAEAIADLRKKCVAAGTDYPVFVVQDPAPARNTVSAGDDDIHLDRESVGEMLESIRHWQMMSAIDAMLVHGALKPGSYLRSHSCKGAAQSVTVSADDLKTMRNLSMMLWIMLVLDDEKTWEHKAPDEIAAQVRHLSDVLAVFLEHAELKPGIYRMDKLLKPVQPSPYWGVVGDMRG